MMAFLLYGALICTNNVGEVIVLVLSGPVKSISFVRFPDESAVHCLKWVVTTTTYCTLAQTMVVAGTNCVVTSCSGYKYRL